jgi:pimeloyl-ACP methyl ester carboxylesterase
MVLQAVLVVLTLVVVVRIGTVVARLRRRHPELQAPLPPHVRDLDAAVAFLRERDRKAEPLKPRLGSQILWAGGRESTRSEVVLLYLHGWSASVREVEPLETQLAQALGANLLCYRLSGHGLEGGLERAGAALRHDCGRDELLRDASEAFALAKLLGRRVVVLGMSTGASLGVWLASQAWAKEDLAALVLLSPAFAIGRLGPVVYHTLKWLVILLPWSGRRLLLAALGGGRVYRQQRIKPEIQQACWTLDYPIEAIAHLVEIYVTLERGVDARSLTVPTLAFANPKDSTADFAATQRRISQMPHGVLDVITDSEMTHNLAGPLCPSTVPYILAQSAEFVNAALATRT